METCICKCPNCGEELMFCPELLHAKTNRPIFMCDNSVCNSDESEIFVLNNVDNFGRKATG